MLSCISFRKILNSLRVDFFRRPKGFMDFPFFFQSVARIGVEDAVLIWVEWARFYFCIVLESQFFTSEL